MSTPMDDATDDAAGRAAALALTAATVPVAAAVAIASEWHGAFLAIFAVSWMIVAVFGGFSFLWMRRNITMLRVVGTGFATGSIVPALGVLVSLPGGVRPTDLLGPLGFGFLGIAGALIAWALLVWQLRNTRAQAFIVAALLAVVVTLGLTL